MGNDWSAIFMIAFIVMLIGSVWGAGFLAMKWAKHPVARLFVWIVLFGSFCVAGTIAIVSGYIALSAPKFLVPEHDV